MSHEQLDEQLINAALAGNLDKVCNLLAVGANPNTLTIASTAPLFIAADIGDVEMIRVMVKAGAKVNMRIDSYQDVHAVRFNHYSISTINQAPLHVAICKGRTDAVKALLKLGANVFTMYGSKKNKPALYLAVEIVRLNVAIREGRTDAVNTLSKLRADEAVQCKKKREDTARDIAKVMIRQALCTCYHETKITLEDGQSVKFNSQITLSWIKDSELFKYYGNCRDEIRKMQNDMLGNSDVSFYQFLSETNPIKLADYLSNANIRKALKRGENIERWKNTYPLFANEIKSIIQSQYNKGMERKNLLNKGAQVLQHCVAENNIYSLKDLCTAKINDNTLISRMPVPEDQSYEAIKAIASRLSDVDMENFIRSTGPKTA